MSFARYSLIVLASAGGSAAALWPLLGRFLGERERLAAAAGAGLAVLNALGAYAIVLWSERRSTSVFLGAVLGGMLGRMALLLAAVVAGVLLLGLPKLPLALSLLAYFVAFLVLELAILHKKTTPRVHA
ncbi:MAG: hypothetical protein AB7O37_00225 [Vicinamibacteria bacterium]